MASKEALILRASRLRSSMALMDDPLGRFVLKALVEALDEAVAEKDSSADFERPQRAATLRHASARKSRRHGQPALIKS
jgi:hypothetical protein